jgi:hypothetical protein
MSNPGVTAALETGPGPGLILWIPLFLVTLAVVGFRLRSSGTDTTDYQPQTRVESNHWGTEHESGGTSNDGTETDSTRPHTAESSAEPDHSAVQLAALERVLSGQGGARNRDFGIETAPPEARLDDHLEHLREELDDDATTELRTLEEVVEEYEDDQPIPEECPGEHCDALWEARTVTGLTTGRYELLDDGEKVICLKCEATFRVESE